MILRLVVLFLAGVVVLSAEPHHEREIERWRAERVANLVAPDSWLTLVGRHLLEPGIHSLGAAKDNDIQLASGPPYLGTVSLDAKGLVIFKPAPSALVRVDGEPVRLAELVYRSEKPTRVSFGSANFYVMQRGDQLYLRMRDTTAPNFKHFAGIDYFDIDPSWRIEATWVPFDFPKKIPITNVLGQTSPAPVPGKAVFTLDGKTIELLPIDEGGDMLFFVLTDLTAGKETYEASRFLYVPKPAAGQTKIILDFNRAENPPCAFTEFATCPLPPKENHLPFRVTAGEKKYRGEH